MEAGIRGRGLRLGLTEFHEQWWLNGNDGYYVKSNGSDCSTGRDDWIYRSQPPRDTALMYVGIKSSTVSFPPMPFANTKRALSMTLIPPSSLPLPSPFNPPPSFHHDLFFFSFSSIIILILSYQSKASKQAPTPVNNPNKFISLIHLHIYLPSPPTGKLCKYVCTYM